MNLTKLEKLDTRWWVLLDLAFAVLNLQFDSWVNRICAILCIAGAIHGMYVYYRIRFLTEQIALIDRIMESVRTKSDRSNQPPNTQHPPSIDDGRIDDDERNR